VEPALVVLAHFGHAGAWVEILVYSGLILGPIAFLVIFARLAKEKPPSKGPE
jgi:hypothetical protein